MTAKKQAGTASSRANKWTQGMATRALNRTTKPRISERAAMRHPIAGHHGVGRNLEAFTRSLLHFPTDTSMGWRSNPIRSMLVRSTDSYSRAIKKPVREATNRFLRPMRARF